MTTYYAHSANSAGQWHLLDEHLLAAAREAAAFAKHFGGEALAEMATLVHDLGKVHPDFQRYLQDPTARRGPDHSSAGAVLIADLFAPLVGLVGGHHGGLPSKEEIRQRLGRVKGSTQVLEAVRLGEASLEALQRVREVSPDVPAWLPTRLVSGREGDKGRCQWELFLRFVFSALVDADFLDTEAHFQNELAESRRREWALEGLWNQYTRGRTEKLAGAPETEINNLRNEIYRSCLEAAELEPGLFRLTVPTGGGKTLSGMAFALRHALTHDLRRIVVAIPYTSIIEQTAEVYRELLDDAVLEHHSAVDWKADDATDPVTQEELWPRLASQNWEAPIVVTTTVQLFESLFSNRPAACRKLHSLAGSVLILDEAQTLPPHLLAPILDVLENLANHYRISVVFCTATQPAVAAEPYSEIFEAAREIVPDPKRYFEALGRVTYEMASEPWAWSRVAREMEGTEQCLTVVNTKRDSLALLDALDDPSALHLSTNLCGAHRRRVLREVQRRLGNGEPCRLVATQVVEAGVDLDFPLVLRAIGPLDRIVQAAGRCNREGRLGPGAGRVVVFDPEEPSALPHGAYKTGTDTARVLFEEGVDLDEPRTYERYFRRLSQAVDLDRKEIQAARAKWDYPRVAEDFGLIDDDSLPMVVPYEEVDEVSKLLDGVRWNRGEARGLFQRLQPYVVNGRRRAVAKYEARGLVQEIVPGLYEWWGRYDELRGVVEEPGLTPEELVI